MIVLSFYGLFYLSVRAPYEMSVSSTVWVVGNYYYGALLPSYSPNQIHLPLLQNQKVLELTQI